MASACSKSLSLLASSLMLTQGNWTSGQTVSLREIIHCRAEILFSQASALRLLSPGSSLSVCFHQKFCWIEFWYFLINSKPNSVCIQGCSKKKKAHTPFKKGHIVQFRPLWKSLLLKLVFITLHLANFIPLALLTNCAFLSFYSSRIKLCEQEPWVDNRDPKSTTQTALNAFPMYTNDWPGTARTLWKPRGCESMGCVVLTSCKKRSK